jgi:hypothetical protein
MNTSLEVDNDINMRFKPIHKICVLDAAGKTSKVIAFMGKNIELTQDNSIFSSIDRRTITRDNPTLVASTSQIHMDDTISTIKKKIINELGINAVAYDELYLFTKRSEPFDLKRIYRSITNNDKNTLTKKQMAQLLANLENLDEYTLEFFNKHNGDYTFKDLKLGFAHHDDFMQTYVSLGQELTQRRDLLFAANPYRILAANPPVFQLTKENQMMTLDNQLLLHYGNIVDNTIYVSLAADMFDYAMQKSIHPSYMVELYLPFLKKRSIFDKPRMLEEHTIMVADTKSMMSLHTMNLYKSIDMYYDVWNNKQSDLLYRKRGIYSFDLILHPSVITNTPLEYIFKQLHVAEDIPYIKYNPGFRREEIYKLYSTQRTKTGKKIPVLKRNIIMNLAKHTAKRGELSIITYYKLNQRTLLIEITISNNGDISVISDCKSINDEHKDDPLTYITTKTLLNILLSKVNPIIASINLILGSSGYSMYSFHGLDDELLEYNEIQYGSHISIRQKIRPSDVDNLLPGIFNIIENNIGAKGEATSLEKTVLRFKRVDNYREMDAVNSLITETYKRTNNIPDIIRALETNFQMSDETARIKITEYLNSHTLLNGKYVNKTIDIAENPGFLCVMQVHPFDNNLEISVSGINSIYYVDILQIYLDGFLRLTQFPETCSAQKEMLVGLLSTARPTKKSVQIENVILPSVQPIRTIQVDELRKMEDQDEIESDDETGLFFEDDDDDEVDDEVDDDDVDDAVDNEAVVDNEDNEAAGFEDDADDSDEKEKEEETLSDDEADNFFNMNGGSKTFFKKMKELEPTLFRTKKEGQYESYARLCPSSSNRQPVILTEEEKQQIDAENPGSYEIAMKYGTDPKKQNWYICPRYWCLQTNTPLTDEQVKRGECGGKVIPQDAKKPPPGHYIYEFTDSRQHKDDKGDYRMHRPGFLPKNSHPSSCLPCCFKRLDTEQQIKRRNECNIVKSDFDGDTEMIDKIFPGDETATKKDRIQLTVLSYDRKILDQHRWGFLPLSIELFLHTDNSKSVSNKNPTIIKENEQPLLRYGVEYSQAQSFIACIADAYTNNREIATPTIREMKDILRERITLDIFIKSHNGSLVINFRPKKRFIDDITVEKYRSSEFYQSIPNKDDYAQNRFLKDTIASYENFMQFIDDKDSFIDHTYLWDIITSSETNLFAGGINLVIIEMLDNDITDNISLVCPTNSYAKQLYDPAKNTLILLKREELYEPIYLYGNTNARKAYSNQAAVKVFNKSTIPKEMVRVIKMIESVSNKHCKATAYKTATVYEYMQNIPAYEVYNFLINTGLYVDTQIVNYHGNVIGLYVLVRAEDTTPIYVPTMPSGLIKQLKRIFVEDIEWLPYEKTRDLLMSIYRKTDKKVRCMPMNKVVEDGLIVGIITQTNQFVQISDPLENLIEDGLVEVKLSGYKGKGYYLADKKLETIDSGDNIRMKTIRNISMENQFYLAFRNKIRLLLNDYMFKEVRDSLLSVLDSNTYLYNVKLQKVVILIKYLLSNSVSFVDISDDVLDDIAETKTFVNSQDIRAICLAKNQTDLCVPINNLISGDANEDIYYHRAADELIRYNRIRAFMLDPEQYLNISGSEQVVYDTEVILLQSTINGGYLNDLVPFETNKYVKNINHSFANPLNSENKILPEIKTNEQYTDIDA